MSLFSVKYQEMLLPVPGVFAELDAFYKKLSAFLLTAHHDDGTLLAAPTPVGAIVTYAGATVPRGWRRCDGTALSRTAHRVLFQAIGTTYGAGDGSATFLVPDLQGQGPMGQFIIYTGGGG